MKREIIRDKTLDWFEIITDNPLFDQLLILVLVFSIGFFSGYLYFRFQIPG